MPQVHAERQSARMPAANIPRRRWRIALLLGIGVVVNYFDRVNLTVSSAAFARDFGMSAATFGVLAGAYNWTYAACQLPIGVILDRFGVKLVGRISILVWSAASFLASIAPNVTSLFGARFLLGVGEAPTFPANAKAVGAWFPSHERSFATSLFDSAAKFSPALGVPVLGAVLLHIGWRWTFALTGIVSLLFAAVFFLVYCEPEEDPGLSADELAYIHAGHSSTPSITSRQIDSLGDLLREPKIIGFSLGFGSYNYVFYLLLSWLPSYLSRAMHVDLLHSFLYTGVPWLAAAFTDLLVGGILVDKLIQNGYDQSRVRMTVLVLGTACGLGIVGAAWSHTPLQALAWITLSISGLSAAAPVGWSIPSLIAPRPAVGKVGGIVNFSNQVSGILAPAITGFMLSYLHSFTGAFMVAGAYLLIGICAYLFLLRDLHPVQV
jgi:MFS family permease